MKCPYCLKKFEPMDQPVQRIKKKIHVQCPHCKEQIKV